MLGEPGEVLPGRVDLGEVDDHLDAGLEQRLGVGRHLERQVEPGDLAQVEPGVVRVDGGHQLELGVVGHRPAHGATHAPACAEHTDASAVMRPRPYCVSRRADDGPVRRRRASPGDGGERRSSSSNGPTTDSTLGAAEHPAAAPGARRRR